ncbi:MAG: nucleoside hydrolase [Pseudomonadota bacterium]
MKRRDIIIDCDPGVDDAVALFLAFSSPDDLNVEAVTTVSGNVPLRLTVRNARKICDLAGRQDVPVFAGSPLAYWRDTVSAEDFHGKDGLEGIRDFEPQTPMQDQHAVSFLIETLRARDTGITLVITGPMTNVALAIRQAPDILELIDEVVLMGGADSEGGNITPHAEFNIYADPHAAEIVFNSGVTITVLSLDVTHKLRTTDERIRAIRDLGLQNTEHIASLLQATNDFEKRQKNTDDGPLHDPSTIAYLLSPSAFSGKQVSVNVDTSFGETLGKTLITDDPNGKINWITSTDDAAVYSLLNERFSRL